MKKINLLVLIGIASACNAATTTVSIPTVAQGSNLQVICATSTNVMSVAAQTSNSYTLQCTAPSPSPSPSASVIPSPSPSPSASGTVVTLLNSMERPEFAPSGSFVSSMSATLARNEIGGFVAKTSSPCNLVATGPSSLSITAYAMQAYTTTTPSSTSATIGKYYDALPPLNATTCLNSPYVWIDITVSPTASPGVTPVMIGDAQLNLTINSLTIPTNPTLPMYVGVESYGVLAGHGLPGATTGVNVQGPLVQSYVNMLRAHRIEPYGQFLAFPATLSTGLLDIDNWSTLNGSYRELVMNGAIAPIMMGPGAGTAPTQSMLQGIEATIKANSITGAWIYLVDEPTASQYPTIVSQAALVHRYAPDLKVMVTTMPATGLSGVDIYSPVENQFVSGAVPSPFFMYVSCMSHGACSGSTPGVLTGHPDLMLDESATNELAFPLTVKVSGGSGALYYQSQYAYSTPSGTSNPWTTQYFFAGNGDGNLFYPGTPTNGIGQTTNIPVASVRLKMLRAGQYLVDYANLSGVAVPSSLVPGVTGWSHSAADYTAYKLHAAGLSLKKGKKK